MKKIMVLPDVHLHGSNYGSHKDCLTESIDVLNRLKAKIFEIKPDYVVLGGDFFHAAKEDNLYLLSVVSSWLFSVGNISKILAIKGNHEVSRHKKYSTYDFIVNSGMVKNDKFIEEENCRVYLVDYSRNKAEYYRDLSSDYTNIGIFHDNIIDSSVLSEIIGETVNPDDIQKDSIPYDYMIINHIHNIVGKYKRTINSKEVEIVIPGSIGRTDTREVHRRNYAKIPVITLNNGQVSIELENLELSDYEEIFELDEDIGVLFMTDKVKLAIDNYVNMFVPITTGTADLSEYIKNETPENLLPKMYEYLGW